MTALNPRINPVQLMASTLQSHFPHDSSRATKLWSETRLRIAAVICAYNPPAIWRDVVERLSHFPFSEVIVVDDGSTPPLVLPNLDDGGALLHLLRRPNNAGLAAARNHALKEVKADWVLFVDADVMPSEDFLATLPKRLEATEGDGLGFHVREHYRRSDWDFYRACERDGETMRGRVEWLSGLLCAYRTSALRAVKGFNPTFRTNGEDVDLGYRLTGAGKLLFHVPEVCGEHYRKDTLGSFLQMQYRYARTAKWVDRSGYFPLSKMGSTPPLFHLRSVWPQIRVMLCFACQRPHAFYLLPLVLAAMVCGAYQGRKQFQRRSPVIFDQCRA